MRLTLIATVDGKKPAPVDMVNILLFTEVFYIPGGFLLTSSINSMLHDEKTPFPKVVFHLKESFDVKPPDWQTIFGNCSSFGI